MGKVLLSSGIAAMAAALAIAQQAPSPADPNVPVSFEVASVKPNKSGERGGSLRRQPGGRVNAVNMPLNALISYAFNVSSTPRAANCTVDPRFGGRVSLFIRRYETTRNCFGLSFRTRPFLPACI